MFGELGLENRVPLAHLIESFTNFLPSQKQNIRDWGNGKDPFSIQMEDKILWREAVRPLLPAASLSAKKETLHGATGTKEVLFTLAKNDARYRRERLKFLNRAVELGWRRLIFAPPVALRKKELPVPEGQLYCLWRWSKLEEETFEAGARARYGGPFYQETLLVKSHRPLCHDWMPAPKIRLERQLPWRSRRDGLKKPPPFQNPAVAMRPRTSPTAPIGGA